MNPIFFRITNGTSVLLRGNIVKSPGAGQDKELHVEEVEILGACDPDVRWFHLVPFTIPYSAVFRRHTRYKSRH